MRVLRSTRLLIVLLLLGSVCLIGLLVRVALITHLHVSGSEHEVVFSQDTTLTCTCFSADRERVFLVTASGTITEVRIADGFILSSIQSPIHEINSLRVWLDESRFVLTFATGGVAILDRITGQFRRLQTAGWLTCFAGSKDGRLFCANRDNGMVYSVRPNSITPIFDAKSSNLVALDDPRIEVGDVSPSGEYIALSIISAVLVLSTNDFRELWIDRGYAAPLVFSRDSKLLASYRHDNKIGLIEPSGTTIWRIFDLPSYGKVTKMTFSEDSKVLYCVTIRRAAAEFTICGLDVESGALVSRIEHIGSEVLDMEHLNGAIVLVDGDGRVLKYPCK